MDKVNLSSVGFLRHVKPDKGLFVEKEGPYLSLSTILQNIHRDITSLIQSAYIQELTLTQDLRQVALKIVTLDSQIPLFSQFVPSVRSVGIHAARHLGLIEQFSSLFQLME